jgi:hypothetical protein
MLRSTVKFALSGYQYGELDKAYGYEGGAYLTLLKGLVTLQARGGKDSLYGGYSIYGLNVNLGL